MVGGGGKGDGGGGVGGSRVGGGGGGGDAGGWGADGGGEGGGHDGEGEEGDVVLFCEADGGAGGGEGGAEGPVEVGKGDAQVDDVVGGGGLEGVGFEDCVLWRANILLVVWTGEKRGFSGESCCYGGSGGGDVQLPGRCTLWSAVHMTGF